VGIEKQTEAQFQATVLAVARVRGWLVFHDFDSRRSTPGFPDLVMARDGDVIFAELKLDGKRPTPAQQAWLDALPAALVGVYCWRPENWPEIEERLK
jgi:hypothetical protein